MSMGNKSSCQWGSGCVSWTGCTLLSELSKSSHRLVRWLCVCQPTCPAPPSLPPPPPRPRPHWSAVPWLLPADQSAWCLLCLGEVNKLLGQSNGKWGARRAGGWPLNARLRRTEGWERKRAGMWLAKDKKSRKIYRAWLRQAVLGCGGGLCGICKLYYKEYGFKAASFSLKLWVSFCIGEVVHFMRWPSGQGRHVNVAPQVTYVIPETVLLHASEMCEVILCWNARERRFCFNTGSINYI